MSTFTDLSIDASLIKALGAANIEEPTDVQKLVIPEALSQKDVQVSAETGSGKTLAYLLPLLHKIKTGDFRQSGSNALILLPTRELAQQTFKECNKLTDFTKARSVLIIGGQESGYQASLLRKDPDVIIATPGRLLEHINRRSAQLDDIQTLVIDEADRMLDMGFRDEVLEIISHCTHNGRQTLLLSATLNHRGVKHIASEILNQPKVLDIANAQTRHTQITQRMLLSDDSNHKQKQLIWLLSQGDFDKALVFANKRLHVSNLNQWLQNQGINAQELHGEIPQDERKHIMSRFNQGHFNVLVATDVAARGLDIDGVELVVNFDMAHSGDEYVHRIGRTGRAGKEGTAISLIADYEWNLAAGIQRYLKQSFEPMVIPGLTGKYKGPKKVKSSGKAAGTKAKKKGSASVKSDKKKSRHRNAKNVGKGRKSSGKSGWDTMSDAAKSGMLPPKRSTAKK
jgi:ATP-dependent RNA helicase SrmB